MRREDAIIRFFAGLVIRKNMQSVTARRLAIALLAGLAWSAAIAQQAPSEVVSFRCGLALDAVIAELDKQAENPVTQQALERLGEDQGEFVCVRTDDRTIVVYLLARDRSVLEGKLVFTVDARTYEVLKTYYGP
jgi:hypothetical protein